MKLIKGGIPDPGERVMVDDGSADNPREAVVFASGFKHWVLEGDVTVRYADDDTLDLVPLERVRRGTAGASE